MNYVLHVIVLAGVFATLSTSLNFLAGYTGLVALCHAVFFGVGAYVAALLAVDYGLPFLATVPSAMAGAAAVSLLVSLPTSRLREDYLVLATFAFQVIAFNVFNNWMAVTRGPLGIPGIPRPAVFGWQLDSPAALAVLSLVFAGAALTVGWRLASSPLGRVLRAIREEEGFPQALGKNAQQIKVTVFALAAAFAGAAGALYAHSMTFIDPTSFTADCSILVLSMVILGGAGSLWGPVLGAALLVTLPEVLRFLGLPTAREANFRQIIYGALLVALMAYRPRGLLGTYRFGK